MISAILYQLTKNLTPEQIKASGFDVYFVDHTTGIYPVAASGTPFTAAYFQSKGDPITDLIEDMAADGTIIQRLYTVKVPYLWALRIKIVVHALSMLQSYMGNIGEKR